jgi:ABC-2 type transport system permease protein
MSGVRVLVGKELREAWRTRRLPMVGLLFIVLGLMSPLAARYLPEILRAALGDQLTVPIPTPVAADAVAQLQKNLGQLGALAAIALAMGAVAGELDRGTAALVLAQPVSRSAFLVAKLVAIALVLGLATLASVAVAWIYAALLFEPMPLGGWLALALLDWLALCAWAAFTFLASAATASTTAAAGLGFVAWIGVSIAAAFPQLDRLLPTGLSEPAYRLAASMTDGMDGGRLATAVIGSVVLIAAAAVASIVAFGRRELR